MNESFSRMSGFISLTGSGGELASQSEANTSYRALRIIVFFLLLLYLIKSPKQAFRVRRAYRHRNARGWAHSVTP